MIEETMMLNQDDVVLESRSYKSCVGRGSGSGRRPRGVGKDDALLPCCLTSAIR